jgi:hypothetical protein
MVRFRLSCDPDVGWRLLGWQRSNHRAEGASCPTNIARRSEGNFLNHGALERAEYRRFISSLEEARRAKLASSPFKSHGGEVADAGGVRVVAVAEQATSTKCAGAASFQISAYMRSRSIFSSSQRPTRSSPPSATKCGKPPIYL